MPRLSSIISRNLTGIGLNNKLGPEPGDIDSTFLTGTGFNFRVEQIAVLSNGKIMTGGLTTTYNGVTVNRIARLQSNGALDTFFTSLTFTDTNNANSNIYAIAVQQPNDMIIAAGTDFTKYGGTSIPNRGIIRLFADGSRDTGFASAGGGLQGFGAQVFSIAVQSDNRILVGGYFSGSFGTSTRGIVRLNSAGNEDSSYNSNLGSGIGPAGSSYVTEISLDANGKAVVVGSFVTFNGVDAFQIVRLNTDGSRDGNFFTTGCDNSINAVAHQADGKILVGGNFTTFNGVSVNRFARLNANGSLDTAFVTNLGSGFDNVPYSILQLSDGTILVGGDFTTFNGVAVGRLVKLNANGTLNTIFNTGVGFNSTVRTIAQISSTRVLVGGWFDSYKGSSVGRFVGLIDAPDATPSPYPTVGDYWPEQGGYYGGRIDYSGGAGTQVYDLVIAAPTYEFTAVIGVGGTNVANGKANTDASTGAAANTVRALTINGFSDWYIPSVYEMMIFARAFKSTNDANNTSMGANIYAVPQVTNFTVSDPAKNPDDTVLNNINFTTSSLYGTSTIYSATGGPLPQGNAIFNYQVGFYNNGGWHGLGNNFNTDSKPIRPIRQVAV
jgi:uncharacterized delta-60 repeat protein